MRLLKPALVGAELALFGMAFAATAPGSGAWGWGSTIADPPSLEQILVLAEVRRRLGLRQATPFPAAGVTKLT